MLSEVIKLIEKFAPPELASFDFVGLIQGDMTQPIRRVGLTLDYSLSAIKKAIETKCDLLITHHGPTEIRYPLIGNNLDKITTARNANIAVYRSHLNLDFCVGGIIDTLCENLFIPATKTRLSYKGYQIYGGINLVQNYPITLDQLKKKIGKLGIHNIRIAGCLKSNFSRIAITSGQGFFGEFMDQLKPDLYIAGEFEQEATKYAEDLGIMLVELGHHQSESLTLARMKSRFSKILGLPVQFIEIPDTIQTIEIKESL